MRHVACLALMVTHGCGHEPVREAPSHAESVPSRQPSPTLGGWTLRVPELDTLASIDPVGALRAGSMTLRFLGGDDGAGGGPASAASCAEPVEHDEQGQCLRALQFALPGVRMSWAARAQGFHQWFVVEDGGAEPLRLRWRVDGASVRIADDGSSATLRGADRWTLDGLSAWDRTGAPLDLRWEPEPGGLALVVETEGASFPVTVDPYLRPELWSYEGNMLAVGLGRSAAAGDLNGDGYSDIVGGATTVSNGQSSEGRSYVFLGSPTGPATSPSWTFESNLAQGIQGWASAVGDYNGDGFGDLAASAPGYSNGQTNEGRIHVFYGSAGGLQTTPAWTWESDTADSWAGRSLVTLDAGPDVAADQLAVGLPDWSNVASGAGRMLVFVGSGAGLATTPAWDLLGSQADEYLGEEACAGHFDGDGVSDLLVFSPYWSNGEGQEGRARVFLGSPTGPSLTAVWTWESDLTTGQIDRCSFGDVDGDGDEDAAFGSNTSSPAASFGGRVWLAENTGSGLGTPTVFASGPANQRFGAGVSLEHDLNADGLADFTYSSGVSNRVYTNQGFVAVHMGTPDGINPVRSAYYEGAFPNNALGGGVSGAGDVDGDGVDDLLIASEGCSHGHFLEGRMEVRYGVGATTVGSPGSGRWGNSAAGGYGDTVTPAGDVNGDGFVDVIVTAPMSDELEFAGGTAFVYHGGASGLAATPAFQLDPGQVGPRAGESAAAAGDVDGDGFDDVIFGLPGWDTTNYDVGKAVVHLGGPTGLDAAAVWELVGAVDQGELGSSVASAGDVDGDGRSDIVVGSPYEDGTGGDTGAARLFPGTPLGPAANAARTWTGNFNERLGTTVGSAGDVNADGFDDVMVTVPGWDNGVGDQGAALLYAGAAAGPPEQPTWVLQGGQFQAGLSRAIGAGDVDGDGYADVLVGIPAWNGSAADTGLVRLYPGGPGGPSIPLPWSVDGERAEAQMGYRLAAAGDQDADGYADILVSAPFWRARDYGAGRALLVLGGPSGPEQVGWTATGQSAEALGMGLGAADIDADGLPELLIGSPSATDTLLYQGRVEVLPGRREGSWDPPQTAADGSLDFEGLGTELALAGDINGDGFDDLLAGMPDYLVNGFPDGRAALYLGGPDGIASTPGWSFTSTAFAAEYGYVGPGGDVNGDGFDDFVVGCLGCALYGTANLFLGAAEGPASVADWTWVGPGDSDTGRAVAVIGDTDGDGYQEIAVGSPSDSRVITLGGSISVFSGGGAGPAAAPAVELMGTEFFGELGEYLGRVGDVNGDGLADLGATSNTFVNSLNFEGKAWVWFGSATGIDSANPWTYSSGAGYAEETILRSAGDFDGDQRADIAVGERFINGGGRVRIFLGSDEGPAAAASATLTLGEAGAQFGASLAAGDLNGDGLDDLAVGAHYRDLDHTNAGSTTIILGQSGGPTPALFHHWTGDVEELRFGTALATGDFDGDGRADLAIGAPGADSGGGDRGRIDVRYADDEARPGTATIRRLDIDSPVSHGSWSEEPGTVVVRAPHRSHLGASPLSIELEVEEDAAPFDGAGTDSAPAAAGGPGDLIDTTLEGLPDTAGLRLRYRYTFEHAASPQQQHGPWFELDEGHLRTAPDVRATTHNFGPTLAEDEGAVDEGASVAIAVLDNDSDVDSALTYGGVTIVGPPVHGEVEVQAAGLLYTHDASETVSDSFEYEFCDGGAPLRCATALVTIGVTPVADTPDAADDEIAVAEGESHSFDPLENDVDADSVLALSDLVVLTPPIWGTLSNDGTTLEYDHGGTEQSFDLFQYQICDESLECDDAWVTVNVLTTDSPPSVVADLVSVDEGAVIDIAVLANDSDDEGLLTMASVTVTAPPAHGSFTILSTAIRYDHNGGEAAGDSFAYRVCDGIPQCSTALVVLTINPINDPPTAGADSAFVDEGGAVVIDVLNNDSDAEGPLQAAGLSVLSAPSYGTVTVGTLGLDYQHNGQPSLTDWIDYQICDTSGACAEAQVFLGVTATNDAPVATIDGGPFVLSEGSSTVGDGSASTDEEGPISFWSWDCDGDDTPDNLGPAVTVCAYPQDGTYSMSLTVSDGNGATGFAEREVVVNNIAPTITSTPDLSVLVSTAWTYAPTATDPGADTLAWSLAEGPGGMAVAPSSGALLWTPTAAHAGTHAVTLVVTDGDGGSDVQDFDIFVGLNDQDGDLDPDELDCADADPLVFHGAAELCNGIDDDCDGFVDLGFDDWDLDDEADCVDTDDDDDGDVDSVDCAPLDPTIGPSRIEICDLVDQDCNPATLDFVDGDGDGFNPCEGDCDDTQAAIHPSAMEFCNNLDDDCDPTTEEGGDVDGDGHSGCEGDCDDADPSRHPGADEGCDGEDTNCDGAPAAVEVDGDGDGVAPCTGDCDDADATRAPGAPESCDGLDQDCDGMAGPPAEDDPDADGRSACAGDCRPFDPLAGPGQAERCDGVDTNCDGTPSVDEQDGDGDGFTTCSGDCDDDDGDTWPGAPEAVTSLVDLNCDGFLGDTDADGDGYSLGGGDCFDALASVHPGAPEICDGFDSDCSGGASPDELMDLDGDGAVDCLDCGPTTPSIFPGAAETCDGLDSDCDGAPLPPGEIDVDADGMSPCAGDCDDTQALVRPGFAEDCGDGLDNDCEGTVDLDTDHDHDGVSSCAGDCRDLDERVFPGSPESCNQLDDDCDLEVDEGWDGDGDGHRPCTGDCDDADPTVYLLAPVVCDDGTDNDCLPSTQEEVDSDGDGAAACDQPGDCWEGNPMVGPAEVEHCNLLDDDCDGSTDEGLDVDGDGVLPCAFDCDDEDATVSPLQAESCEGGLDDDCDGTIDEGCEPTEELPTPGPGPGEEAGCQCGSLGQPEGLRGGTLGWMAAGLLVAALRRTGRAARRQS